MSTTRKNQKPAEKPSFSNEQAIIIGLKSSHIATLPPGEVREQLTKSIELLALHVPDFDNADPADHAMLNTLVLLRQSFDKADSIQRHWKR